MKRSTSKKKRRQPATKTPAVNDSSFDASRKMDRRREGEDNESRGVLLNSFMEAFGSISLDEATLAYNQANGDLEGAAEILSNLIDNGNNSEDPDPSTSSVSSGSSSSGFSGSGFAETGCVQNLNNGRRRSRGGKQQKRAVAATGTVSTVLGKDYVRSSPWRDPAAAAPARSVLVKEDEEQFLCSMLGDECELSMAVVRDVLCQCGYNVEKLADRTSDCMSNSSESELQDSIWSMGYSCRSYAKVLASSEDMPPSSPRSNMLNLPQEVLDSLFNIPKHSEHEPQTLSWRNVVKKMQSLGPAIDIFPSTDAETHQDIYVKGDEYHKFRKRANEHWDSMRSYHQKAVTAYSKGELGYAAYLSDQGKVQTKLAREADERASQDIFKVRNKAFENVITIDLHGQHVKQAMRLLKLHLLFGIHVPSVRTLRVITGCGTHGIGESKLKQSIIKLLEKEDVQWREENRGTLLVKLDGYREFSFLDANSDTE
ncbi:SMR domain-containing protein At5g58720-like isoform X3 [Hibiscus syriacus]|uniref:SMR domain-containing protein At5g58720-like isoform X3 n=1 Tax=Hibiscus syriacus TaxID=106335 RepID=UPI0019221301|nr:SMR domain-containing protein At5g58720-like isoform X3 [Hibiscus syriacus]